MPRVYEVEYRLENRIRVVVPDDMPDAEAKHLIRRKEHELMAFARHETDVVFDSTCTLQEAADMDGDEWRLDDDRQHFVRGQETDWVEGKLDEEPVDDKSEKLFGEER